MRQRIKTTAFCASLALPAALEAPSSWGADFGVRFNPAASFSAAMLGGRGVELAGERFVSRTWSVGAALGYSQTNFRSVNSLVGRFASGESPDESAKRSRVSFDAVQESAVGCFATRYHGPG